MDEKLILCEEKISPLKINEAKYFEEQRLLWNSLIVPITEHFIVIFWKRLAKEALLKIENFMKRGYRQHQIKFTGILIHDDDDDTMGSMGRIMVWKYGDGLAHSGQL